MPRYHFALSGNFDDSSASIYQSLYGGQNWVGRGRPRKVEFSSSTNSFWCIYIAARLEIRLSHFFFTRHLRYQWVYADHLCMLYLCWSHMHASIRNKYSKVALLCELHMHLCKLCGINVTIYTRIIAAWLYICVWKRKEVGEKGRRERERENTRFVKFTVNLNWSDAFSITLWGQLFFFNQTFTKVFLFNENKCSFKKKIIKIIFILNLISRIWSLPFLSLTKRHLRLLFLSFKLKRRKLPIIKSFRMFVTSSKG